MSLPSRRTTPGAAWVCRDCGFKTDNTTEALAHPWLGDNFSHWLYEYPNFGDTTQYPYRELHSSDAGGCYLSPVSQHNEPQEFKSKPPLKG